MNKTRETGTERLICLTIDVCEDIHSSQPWAHLEHLEELRERLAKHLSARGHECRITWFPRADRDIAKTFGTATSIIERPVFATFIEKGDEIGWHAHFYNELGIQVADGKVMAEEARAVLPSVKEKLPDVESTRFGRLHLTNELAAVLAEHGFRQDANCLPGRKEERENMIFDWSTSPETPYRLSEKDYRSPASPCLDIVELPYSMKAMRAAYDKAPVRRYIDIAFHHELIKEDLDELNECEPVVLVCHPFELLSHKKEHGLVAFDIDVALKNLDTIIEHFEMKGETIRFITIKEAGSAWRNEYG